MTILHKVNILNKQGHIKCLTDNMGHILEVIDGSKKYVFDLTIDSQKSARDLIELIYWEVNMQ